MPGLGLIYLSITNTSYRVELCDLICRTGQDAYYGLSTVLLRLTAYCHFRLKSPTKNRSKKYTLHHFHLKGLEGKDRRLSILSSHPIPSHHSSQRNSHGRTKQLLPHVASPLTYDMYMYTRMSPSLCIICERRGHRWQQRACEGIGKRGGHT